MPDIETETWRQGNQSERKFERSHRQSDSDQNEPASEPGQCRALAGHRIERQTLSGHGLVTVEHT